MTYKDEDGQIKPSVYKRIIWQNSLKLVQLVIYGIVIDFSNAYFTNGGDTKWHFRIVKRNQTNL